MFLITFHQHRDGYRPPRDRRRTWADRLLYSLCILLIFLLTLLLGKLTGW